MIRYSVRIMFGVTADRDLVAKILSLFKTDITKFDDSNESFNTIRHTRPVYSKFRPVYTEITYQNRAVLS